MWVFFSLWIMLYGQLSSLHLFLLLTGIGKQLHPLVVDKLVP
jgi:hypothetical protein